MRCQNKFDINLQLREQLWIYTRFPFNRIKCHSESVSESSLKAHECISFKPKFGAKLNILFKDSIETLNNITFEKNSIHFEKHSICYCNTLMP